MRQGELVFCPARQTGFPNRRRRGVERIHWAVRLIPPSLPKRRGLLRCDPFAVSLLTLASRSGA